jgi:hypothetical protein
MHQQILSLLSLLPHARPHVFPDIPLVFLMTHHQALKRANWGHLGKSNSASKHIKFTKNKTWVSTKLNPNS